MSLSRISLGTAQLGSAYGIANRGGSPSAKTVDEILDLAISAGVPYIDTAPIYGEAEKRIGRFIQRRGVEDAFEICTKLSHLDDDLPSSEVARAVDRSIESSLGNLGVPVLSEYLIHDVELLHRHGRSLVDALLNTRERGRIRKVGVSVYGHEDLVALDEFPELEIVQHPLSVFDQRLLESDRLERLQSDGTVVQARSVFLQGLLTLSEDSLPKAVTHARDTLSKYSALLSDSGLTAEAAALLFVCRTDVDRVIIGTETATQLESNIETISKTMPEELFQRLRAAFRELPGRIIDPRRWPG